MEVAALSDDYEIPPQRGRGNKISVYDKGEGEVRAARHTFGGGGALGGAYSRHVEFPRLGV